MKNFNQQFRSVLFWAAIAVGALSLTACKEDASVSQPAQVSSEKEEFVAAVRTVEFYDEVEYMADQLMDHVKNDCSKETIGGREKCYQAWQKSMRAEWRDAESATARYKADKAWSHFRFRELEKTTWRACLDKANASGHTLEIVHCYARMYAFHQTWVNFFESGDYIQTLANDPEHHKFSGKMLQKMEQYDSSQEVGS